MKEALILSGYVIVTSVLVVALTIALGVIMYQRKQLQRATAALWNCNDVINSQQQAVVFLSETLGTTKQRHLMAESDPMSHYQSPN